MYEKIKGVSIKGGYFEPETQIDIFENPSQQIALIYGKNGSGKSSLADAISEYKYNKKDWYETCFRDFTMNELEKSEEVKNNVYVYNEEFIDNNFKVSEGGLETIVLLGEQVDVEDKIEKAESLVNDKNREFEKLHNVILKFENEKDALSHKLYKNKVLKSLSSDNGWASRDRDIKEFKRKSSVDFNKAEEIVKNEPKKTKEELQEIYSQQIELLLDCSKNATKIDEEIRQQDIDKDIDNKIMMLLTKKIEKTEFNDIENEIYNEICKGNNEIVNRAKEEFSKDSVETCPYCHRTINKNEKSFLIKCIDKVLNKVVEEHKSELQKSKIANLEYNLEKHKTLDTILYSSIRDEIIIINKTIDYYNENIDKKINNPFDPINIDNKNLVELYESLNSKLYILEEKRIEINSAIDDKNGLKERLKEVNDNIAFYEIEEDYSIYKRQFNIYNQKIEEESDLNEKINELTREIERLKSQKRSVHIAVDEINKGLEYVFLNKKRITIQSEDGKYKIKSNGMDVKPENVSCGERNIISLIYFFYQVIEGEELKNAYSKEKFIVIDDPVSSFDIDNRMGILSYLKYQTQNIMSGNKKTKMIYLTHDIATMYDFEKIAQEVCKFVYDSRDNKTKYKDFYTCLNFNNKATKLFYNDKGRKMHQNEYTELLNLIYNYAKGESSCEMELVMGNIIRRVLEAFSTFEYKKGIVDISNDKDIIKKLGDKKSYYNSLMYRFVLNGESHLEDRVKNLKDMRLFSEISSEQRINTAQDILCFMYLLNGMHMKSHLPDEAIESIKEWCNNDDERADTEIPLEGKVLLNTLQ